METEQMVLEVRRSWLNWFWVWWSFVLVIPFLFVMLARNSMCLQIHPDKLVLREGILARNEREIFCSDIRTVDTTQSAFQRIFGIGAIRIATAGTGGFEFEMSGVKHPGKIKDLLMENKRCQAAGA